MIQLHDKHFEAFISEKELDYAIQNLAKQIEDDFYDEVPIFVGILNGSFMFLSDLMKYYGRPCEIEFVKLSSYEGTQSTNDVKQLIGLNQNLEGRSVIIVEDIVDTGLTLSWLKANLESRGAKSVEICTIFRKPDAAKVEVNVKYIGFDIPPAFIVGYGLDFNEKYRNLSVVAVLSPHMYS